MSPSIAVLLGSCVALVVYLVTSLVLEFRAERRRRAEAMFRAHRDLGYLPWQPGQPVIGGAEVIQGVYRTRSKFLN